jgi:hypothetical protein
VDIRRLKKLREDFDALNPDGPSELNAISNAVEVILRLKVERLGWPNPTGSARSFPAARYAHTFLFMCPECNMPIAISRIRPERNLETIESRKFDLKCAYCNETPMPAPMAMAHWVTDWA